MRIAHPPQQQIHSYHLALSVILLILTVYPYLFNPSGICCSVAAYSSDDLDFKHYSIEKFDLINTDGTILTKSIPTVATQEQHLHEKTITRLYW